jgi:hypothetical protein
MITEGRLDKVLAVPVPDIDKKGNIEYQKSKPSLFGLSPLTKNKSEFEKVVKKGEPYYTIESRSLNMYYGIPRGIHFFDNDVGRLKKTIDHLSSNGHDSKVYRHDDGKKTRVTISNQGEYLKMESISESIINEDNDSVRENINNMIKESLVDKISKMKQNITNRLLGPKDHNEDAIKERKTTDKDLPE